MKRFYSKGYLQGMWQRVRLVSLSLMLSLLSSQIALAQNLISGVVLGDDSTPLIGATIIEEGSNGGTTAGVDGQFSLHTSKPQTEITISFIGYNTQRMVVNAGQNYTIQLENDAQLFEEIVVVGYGTKRKGGISAAVSTINSSDIARSTSTTTAGALVGKVSGVTFRQKSGSPGSATSLQIRNMGAPLYVIDGIMRDGAAFNNINPNDIENISILKDGAAAIYGVKAANGVVLVTTKGGKLNSKAEVSVNSYVGWQQWTKYPELLNASEWVYANYMRDVNNGVNVDPVAAQAEMDKWDKGLYNPETGEDYRGYNWQDEMVNKAAPQYYTNINITGGSDKTTYYISLAQTSQDAVFKDFNFTRTNLQTNITTHITDSFRFKYQMNGKITNNSTPGLPGADDYSLVKTSLIGLQPIYRPYANNNPDYLNYIEANDARNIAALTAENAGSSSDVWTSMQNNFSLEYDTPIKGLSAKGIFSYYFAAQEKNTRELSWKEYTYNAQNDEYVERYEKGETYLGRKRDIINEITGQTLLNYDRKFAGKHHVTAVAGFEFFKFNGNAITNAQSPIDNSVVDLIGNSQSNNTVSESKAVRATSSFIFRAGYNYADKYIIDFASRYDASWRFAPEDRWGFFPSVSGAWRVSEEGFFKDSDMANWFTNLKIRASYGEMGNENMGGIYPDFAYMSGYNYFSGNYLLPTDLSGATNSFVVGTSYGGIPITNISWITAAITNIGIDLGFFGNKLTAEFDAFRRSVIGIPATPDDIIFPNESGISAMPANLNSNYNLGIDGFITWRDKVGDFKYSIGLNATLARQMNGARYGEKFFNSWDEYFWSQSDRWSNVANGQVWMWNAIGTFKTQEQIDNYPVDIDGNNNKNLVPGDVIFEDVNGDGLIDNYDKRPLGYAAADMPNNSSNANKNPLLSFGLNLGFEWKGIDFAADLAGASMNTFVPDWHMKWGVNRKRNSYSYNSLDVWHHEDILDPTSPWVAGQFPALRQTNPSTRGENNYYTKNVNYLRLRNLVIGYTLPKKLIPNMKKIRLYVEGTNLLCWDTLGDYGIDPETSTVNGTDYPQARVYAVGVNITF